MDDIQNNLFEQARAFREKNPHSVSTYDDFKNIIKKEGGFIRCGWDGTDQTEAKIKDETRATIRCILINEKIGGETCVYSGASAKYIAIFAKAY